MFNMIAEFMGFMPKKSRSQTQAEFNALVALQLKHFEKQISELQQAHNATSKPKAAVKKSLTPRKGRGGKRATP